MRFFVSIGLCVVAIVARAKDATPQPAGATNAIPTGPLAGLAQMAMTSGDEDELPTKLSGLLWPNSGNHRYSIKKFSMPTREEGKLFCVRTDTQDLALVRSVETKPNEDTKKRKEIYYRTTAKGDLKLVVIVRFEFTIDDVDNEVLKKMSSETYGDISGDGKKPLAITADLRAQFEAEKKYWLKSQKKLRKAAGARKAD